MDKKRNYIVNLLMSAIIAFLLSYCFFEESIAATVCIFVVLLRLSCKDKANVQKPLPKNKFLFLGLLVMLGFILILIGKFVSNSDTLIIIGAMLFSIIAPLILIFLGRLIMKIRNEKKRN